MQAIEFETTAFQHTVRIPDTIPDGVPIKIILLYDNTKISPEPSPFNLSRYELNNRSPDYLTIAVDEIDIPARDERYER